MFLGTPQQFPKFPIKALRHKWEQQSGDGMGWGKLAKKIILRGQNFGFQKSGNIAILGLSGPEREIVLLRFF